MTELAVIVPNYNNARFLMGAIQSIFDSRGDLKVPVVLAIGDDGSTDNGESLKIINAVQDQFDGVIYPENHPYKLNGLRNSDRLIVHLAEKNGGKNPLLNVLIPKVEKTGAEFTVILDADDKLTAPMFHECLPFMNYVTHHPEGTHKALLDYCDFIMAERKNNRRFFGEPVLLKYVTQDLKENDGELTLKLMETYRNTSIFSLADSDRDDRTLALSDLQKETLRLAETYDRSRQDGAWKKSMWLRHVSKEISKGISGTDFSILSALSMAHNCEDAKAIGRDPQHKKSWRRICAEPNKDDAAQLKKYKEFAQSVRENTAPYEANSSQKDEVIWLMHQYQLLEEKVEKKKDAFLKHHRKDSEFLSFVRDIRSNPKKYDNLAMLYTGSELLSAEGAFLGLGKPKTFNRFDYRDKSFIPQTGVMLTRALASAVPYDDTGIDPTTGKRRPRTKWFMFLKLFGDRTGQIIRLTELDKMKNSTEQKGLRTDNLSNWPKEILDSVDSHEKASAWSALYVPQFSFTNRELLQSFIYTMHKGNVSGIGSDLTNKGSNARKKRLLEGNGYIKKDTAAPEISAHHYDVFDDGSFPYRVEGAKRPTSSTIDLSAKWQGAGQATATLKSTIKTTALEI